MATTYLTRTNSSAGSGTKFTISTWLKRSSLSTGIPRIMEFYHSTSYYISLRFRDDSTTALQFYSESNGSGFGFRTNQVFRDVGAFYHIVLSVDTTVGTADDRQKLYINGEQVTSFSARANPTSSVDLGYNTSSATNYIGRKFENSDYFAGLMSHFHFIDGTAYDASAFGETDSTTGNWKAKTSPSVTYGTNGFFLKGENSSALGTDSSGKGNNFTVNGTPTQTIDTPSNVFATVNPLHFGSDAGTVTMSNGNTTFSNSGNDTWRASTQAVSSGKYYAEFKATGTAIASGVGINNGNQPAYIGSNSYDYIYGFNGIVYNNDSNAGGSFTAPSTNDIIGVALDLDNNKIYWSLNGTWLNSGDPTSGATGTGAISVADPSTNGTGFYHFAVGDAGTGTVTFLSNFGNGYFGTTAVASAQNPDDGIGIFEYDVPAGYRALCTKSINAQEYS